MRPDRDQQALEDMPAHARRVASLVRERNRSDLEADWIANAALIRQLEVIGEAASRVSQGTPAQLPAVPWRAIVAMRNRLIHAYDVIDPDAVWRAASEDVPALLDELERVLGGEA
jgi:uncharacterized protein with HEPN domain